MGTKIVYNDCFGGFSLSKLALNFLKENSNFEEDYDFYQLPRHHPLLVKCVELMGEKAGDNFASLKIKEIDSNLYIINDYDGMESIVTPDKIKWIDSNIF